MEMRSINDYDFSDSRRRMMGLPRFEWKLEYELKPQRIFTANKIASVEFFPPATKMTFTDDTVTTAVAQPGDEFSKEVGMMVCIMKYIFGDKSYNNMFRKWIKKDEYRKKEAEKSAAEKRERAEIKKRQAEKEAKRKAKRTEQAREREIEIQKEAYIRAMRELEEDKEAEAKKEAYIMSLYGLGDDKETEVEE